MEQTEDKTLDGEKNDAIDDGGPAFPSGRATCDVTGDDYAPFPGMTLRDYFAGQAMESMIGPPDDDAQLPCSNFIAEQAYLYADAMLAARTGEK